MIERELEIINRLGLHARAAAKLVNLASRYTSEIQLTRNQRTVNGKSIMGVMMLAASQGTTVLVTAEGEDEDEAIEQIEQLIRDRFGEEE